MNEEEDKKDIMIKDYNYSEDCRKFEKKHGRVKYVKPLEKPGWMVDNNEK